MGVGFMEVPDSAIPPIPTSLFLNSSLGSLSCSSSISVTGTSTAINFPRTACNAVSGDSNHNQSYPPVPYSGQVTGKVISTNGFFQESSYSNPVAWMGRFDIALINGSWEGWDNNGTYDRGLLVDAIRQITHVTGFNPTDVWQYVLFEERYTNNGNQPYNTLYLNGDDANHWGLYGQANQAGSPVADSFGGGYACNWAVAWPNAWAGAAKDQQFSPARTTAAYDGSAEDLPQYATAYFIEELVARHSSFTTTVDGTFAASGYTDSRFYPNLSSGANHDAMKAPNLGGLFQDNLFCYAQTAGFYDLQSNYGTYVTTGPLIAFLVRGSQHFHHRYGQILAKCYPSRTYLNVGNIGHWLRVWWDNKTTFTSNAVCGGMSGYLDGGLWEGTIGATWSFDTNYGTVAVIQAYQANMAFLSGPKKGVIHSYPANASDFKTARYGLGITLMDDGYYCTSVGQVYTVNENLWMDEYGGNPGTNIGKGWLGQRNGSKPTTAAVNGVWIADFQHGTCLLNPTGNGSQTITNTQINNYLRTSYNFSFIKGIQVPAINTGASMTSVTIAAGDAVLLMH